MILVPFFLALIHLTILRGIDKLEFDSNAIQSDPILFLYSLFRSSIKYNPLFIFSTSSKEITATDAKGCNSVWRVLANVVFPLAGQPHRFRTVIGCIQQK